MSGESPAQNMLNQGGGGVHGSSGNIGATTTTTSALGSMGSMMPNSVGSPAGAEPQLNATQLPSSQGSVPPNTGQVSQNLGTGVPNYLGHTQILGQQKPGMGRQQQQQQMLACSPSALQAQQNLGSNPSQSPTGSLSSMHRSSSANRLGQLPYTSSAVRPPPLYGHGQLPFNPHLQHQQQPQMTRSGMIGQGPSPAHLSILSGQSGQLSGFSPQFLSQQQVRQKPGQIQGSQFQQPVSSGQPLQSMQAIGLMGSIGLGSQNRIGSLYAQQRIGQGTLRSPPSQSPQQSLSSPQVDSHEKLDPAVEDFLLEIAEDFIHSVTSFACALAKHRKSATLEAKDVLLHLEKNWHLPIPGFAGKDCKTNKSPSVSEVHLQRLAVIQKSVAAPQVETKAGSTNDSAGLAPGSSNAGNQEAKAIQNSSTALSFSTGNPGVQKVPRF